MIGIFALKLRGRYFVDYAKDVARRVREHGQALDNGIHSSKRLQDAFKEFGNPDVLLLKEYKKYNIPELEHDTKKYIRKYEAVANGYNGEGEYQPNQNIIEAFKIIDLEDTDICLETGITPDMLKDIRTGSKYKWLESYFENYKEIIPFLNSNLRSREKKSKLI